MADDLKKLLNEKREITNLAMNDIKMARDGFKFEKGNLNFYLRSGLLPGEYQLEIERIKQEQGI